MNEEYIQNLEDHGFIHDTSNSWEAVYDRSKQHLDPFSRLRSRLSEQEFSGNTRGGRFLRLSTGNGEPWFVKQYHRGGVLSERGDTGYASPDRFLSELFATVRARELDLPVPEPIGVFWYRTDSAVNGFYVSEWVESIRATQHLRDKNDPDLMFHLGQILARLHDEGIDHQDYKLDNALVDEQENVHIIDFDPVRFGNVNIVKREQRLHRFLRFMSKYGFDPCDENAFLDGYRTSTESFSRTVHHALRLPNWIRNSTSDLLHCLSDSPLKPVDLENVLVRVPNWLGDCVMSLPFLQSLTDELEQTHVDVVCRNNLQSLFEASSSVRNVYTLNTDKTTTYPDEVRQKRYSLVVILPKSFRTALQAWRSGIPRRRGFSTGLRSPLLTDRIPLDGKHRTMHHARLYYELMPDLLEQPDKLPSPDVSPPDTWQENTPEEWYQGKYITIHPGSAYGPAKRWPAEQFQEMLQSFLSKHDTHLTFIGVSSEREIADSVKKHLPEERITDLVGKTTLEQCMVVLHHSQATVANDSGIMHLTAALNTPVLALFGSSTPELTSPLGEEHHVIYKNVECSPCFEETCPRSTERYKCLTQIQPSEAYERLASLLEETDRT